MQTQTKITPHKIAFEAEPQDGLADLNEHQARVLENDLREASLAVLERHGCR